MPRHFSYPSIGLFRIAVKKVSDWCAYSGVSLKPKLSFKGAVKLHGVNTAVVLSEGAIYAQSREVVLSTEADLNGFAKWVTAHESDFRSLLGPLLEAARASARPDQAPHSVILYGEWFGKGVQSGVAISQLEKTFCSFGLARVRSGTVRENGEMVPGEIYQWTPPGFLRMEIAQMVDSGAILCIEDFPTWEIEVDFERPEEAQARLVEITQAVEKQCPVGHLLGVEGIGEGVVWTCQTPSSQVGIPVEELRFKVKGEKHSDNAGKELAPVDIERLKNVEACVLMVATPHRFEKALDHVRATRPEVDRFDPSNIGPFLKWIGHDVGKEEGDTVAANGLDPREVVKAVSAKARSWFLERKAERLAQAPTGG